MPPTTINTLQILKGDMKALRAAFDAASQSEPDTGSDDQPSATLADISAAIHRLKDSTTSDNTDGNLPAAIETLLGNQSLHLEPAHKIRLFVADKLFAHLFANADLDCGLVDPLRRLHLPFVGAALADDAVFCDKNNVMRRLVDDVYSQAATWYLHPGKIGRAFADKLEATIAGVTAIHPWNPEQARRHQQAFFNDIAADIRRAKSVEARTCETELGLAKIAQVQARVVAALNESIGGSRLPAAIAEFILTSWKAELQLILINEGPEAELWKRWQAILKTLAQAFRPELEAQERKGLYNDIPVTLRLLEKPVALHTCPEEDYQQFLAELESSLVQVLKGADVESVAIEPLQVPEEFAGVAALVSQSLVEKAEQIKEGDWFLFSSAENETVRCKFALKMSGTDQLLFVNRNGHKVMRKSVDEFVICLSSKIARPLCIASPFRAALTQALEDLTKRCERNLASTRMKKEAEARIKAHMERHKQQQLQAEERARKAAAAKARKEAAALAREKARQEKARAAALAAQRQQALLEQQAEAERNRAAAQAALDQLQIGAWVEVPGKDNAPVRCKLAVSIRSSGRYIFVDRLGTKVAEYTYQELITMLATKTATIFDRGENFEDQLAKIVRGLRKNIF